MLQLEKMLDSTLTTPPRKGWQYVDGAPLLHAPEMECGKPFLQCKSVSLELSGIKLKVYMIGFVSKCNVRNAQGQSSGPLCCHCWKEM